jgi:hypothetical protein
MLKIALIGPIEVRNRLGEAIKSQQQQQQQQQKTNKHHRHHSNSNTNNILSISCDDMRDILKLILRYSNDLTTTADLASILIHLLSNEFNSHLLPSIVYKQETAMNVAGVASNINTTTTTTSTNTTCFSSSSDSILLQLMQSSTNVAVESCGTNGSRSHSISLNSYLQTNPIFILFKVASGTVNRSNERKCFVDLLKEIYMRQPRIGYILLFYMRLLQRNPDTKANEFNVLVRIYKQLATTTTTTTINSETKMSKNRIKKELKT